MNCPLCETDDFVDIDGVSCYCSFCDHYFIARQKQPRGFAAMSPDQRRAIGSKGGKAAHAKGTGRQWTIMEARIAGRKGGKISRGGRGKDSTMAKDERYQGWTNYETWNVVLWLNNDEGLYNGWRQYRATDGTPFTAKDARGIVTRLLPKGTPDFDSPADYDKVDWAEVAAALNED